MLDRESPTENTIAQYTDEEEEQLVSLPIPLDQKRHSVIK